MCTILVYSGLNSLRMDPHISFASVLSTSNLQQAKRPEQMVSIWVSVTLQRPGGWFKMQKMSQWAYGLGVRGPTVITQIINPLPSRLLSQAVRLSNVQTFKPLRENVLVETNRQTHSFDDRPYNPSLGLCSLVAVPVSHIQISRTDLL